MCVKNIQLKEERSFVNEVHLFLLDIKFYYSYIINHNSFFSFHFLNMLENANLYITISAGFRQIYIRQ